MGNGENSKTQLLAYIGGIVLAAGVLVSVGQLVQRVHNQSSELQHVQQELNELRGYINQRNSDHSQYTKQDSARDLAVIDGRLARLERRLERLEDRK